jgi:hypothetical protein
VLVVHEDPAFTCAVGRILADAGYAVVECNQRDEALLGVVQGEYYELILYDVLAGPEEAIDFHREVAVMKPDLAARIVFLSVDELPESLPNPRIVKPLGADSLREWIAEFVSLRTMPPVAPTDEGESTRTVSREMIIADALAATLRTLRSTEQTRRVRELQAQARSYEAALKRWATVPPGAEQVGAMFELVTELHEEVNAAIRGVGDS